MTSKLASAVAVAVSLAFAGTAQATPVKQYVLKHPKHEHCRAHYTRKVETVQKREHGRTVKVKETVCVDVPLKAPAKAVAPAPNTPSEKAAKEAKEKRIEAEIAKLKAEAEARKHKEEAEKHKEETAHAEEVAERIHKEEVIKKKTKH